MQIEEALRTALVYENKVRDVYIKALEDAEGKTAKRVFRLMAREEEEHVRFLEDRLDKWLLDKSLDLGDLASALPSSQKIEAAVASIGEKADTKGTDKEIEILEKALEVEKETSAFYENLVKELPEEGRSFFARFMEIERGHVDLVQAEMDALRGDGFWFDMPEFDLEGA